MNKKTKGLAVGIFIIGAALVALHFFAQHKVGKALDTIKKGELTYEDYSVNIFSGSLSIKAPSFTINQQAFKGEKISVQDVHYFAYLLSDSIVVDKLIIKKPRLQLSKKKDTTKSRSKKNNFSEKIRINKVELVDGSLHYKEDSIQRFSLANFDVKLKTIKTGAKQLKDEIPFTYSAYSFLADSLVFEANKYQRLTIKKIELTHKKMLLQQLNFVPTKSREDYVNYIPYEKDLMDLTLENLSVPEYSFAFKNKQPHFSAKLLEFNDVNFSIYRDKTVRDDTRKKDMYSAMLRKLKLKLKIDSVALNRTELTYEEKLKPNRKPGKVNFKNLHAGISNISNVDLDREDFPTTKLDITTSFFGKSSLQMHWQFKINDTIDRFSFDGQVKQIPPSSMNAFFVPGMNMKAKGNINAIYYNFSGNKNIANGTTKMLYDDFAIEVLKENGESKDGVLSFLADIFVNKSPENGAISTRVKKVKRDKTKSFWNYFWSCLEAGIKKSLI